MPTRRLVPALLAGLILASAPALRADTVRLLPDATIKAPGGQFSGQITAETPTDVKIKTALGEQTVPLNQIDAIEYDAATPSLTLAESRMNVGAVSEAIDLYSKAIAEAKGKTFVERAAQYGKASALADLALADPSKLDEAIASLGSFIQANGNSRQLGPALESMIQLNLIKGDVSRAQNALDELAAKVPTATARAAVLKARILGKKGQHDQAIQELDRLIAQAPKGSAQSREAMLAKSENLVALKKFSDAEQVVRQVIEQAPPEADNIQAEAHNTLGDCLKAAGDKKGALLAYLRTDILFDSDKEQHPRALSQIAQMWRALGEDARADEVIDRLRQLYPQSPYAQVKLVPRQ